MSFAPDDTSIRILSHAYAIAYFIDLTTSQDVSLLGVDVTMYVVNEMCIPRNRYLRRVTHETFVEYGHRLYADVKNEEELMREHVDTTVVSDVLQAYLVKLF